MILVEHGAETSYVIKRDEGNFEEVRNRGGSRTYGTPEVQSQTPKLSLGNKYGALPQDQS